jgi:CRISPR/Cas system CSM-associated protein Csm4 (group 5 of RAMP superfamily)
LETNTQKKMKTPKTIHQLYLIAFEEVRDKARMLGVTLKAIVKSQDYSGKILRRGTPGAFGWVPKPR